RLLRRAGLTPSPAFFETVSYLIKLAVTARGGAEQLKPEHSRLLKPENKITVEGRTCMPQKKDASRQQAEMRPFF
ncbi:MAG: hypothetical protein ACOCQT_01115, partial [Desulfovermiculus sp.]